MIKSILIALSAALTIAEWWVKRQDAEKLRESGKAEEVARASRALLATLEKAHAVDAVLLDGDDPEWVSRVRKAARSGGDTG